MSKSTKYCRICLVENNNLLDINQKDSSRKSSILKLTKLVPQMKTAKNLSKLICQDCFNQLNISFKFYEKCIKTLNLQDKIAEVSVVNLNDEVIEDGNITSDNTTVKTEDEQETNSLTNTSEEIIKCVICNAEFPGKNKLQDHIKVAHAVRKLLQYDSYGTVKRATEKETQKFISEVKTRNSNRISLLENSQTLLNSIKSETLNVTDMDTSEINQTTKENEVENTKIKKSKKKYECIFCAKIVENKVQLTKHVQLHEISIHDKKNFKCKECDASFNELKRLVLHVRSIHENIETFPCSKCSVVCSSMRSLRAHMHIHDGTKPGPGYLPHENGGFKCLQCGMRLASRSSIGTHFARHSSARSFICPAKDCNSTFKTKVCLTQHMSSQHEHPIHPCPVCDRVFNYKYALFQHLATHVNAQKETN